MNEWTSADFVMNEWTSADFVKNECPSTNFVMNVFLHVRDINSPRINKDPKGCDFTYLTPPRPSGDNKAMVTTLMTPKRQVNSFNPKAPQPSRLPSLETLSNSNEDPQHLQKQQTDVAGPSLQHQIVTTAVTVPNDSTASFSTTIAPTSTAVKDAV